MKEVSSAPNKDVNVRGMETTAANSESEQGDQLHQRAVRYNTYGRTMGQGSNPGWATLFLLYFTFNFVFLVFCGSVTST